MHNDNVNSATTRGQQTTIQQRATAAQNEMQNNILYKAINNKAYGNSKKKSVEWRLCQRNNENVVGRGLSRSTGEVKNEPEAHWEKVRQQLQSLLKSQLSRCAAELQSRGPNRLVSFTERITELPSVVENWIQSVSKEAAVSEGPAPSIDTP
ncbi:uncharacterized protein V6R79_000799 [Siganus canaliculatus]